MAERIQIISIPNDHGKQSLVFFLKGSLNPSPFLKNTNERHIRRESVALLTRWNDHQSTGQMLAHPLALEIKARGYANREHVVETFKRAATIDATIKPREFSRVPDLDLLKVSSTHRITFSHFPTSNRDMVRGLLVVPPISRPHFFSTASYGFQPAYGAQE